MKKIILIILIFILLVAGCTKSVQTEATDIKTEEYTKAIETATVSLAPIVEITPTATPEPTATPAPEPTPYMLELYDITSFGLVEKNYKIADVQDYKLGDNIYHVDNEYNYCLEIPYDWSEKTKIKQFGYNAIAYQEYIIDFDDHYEFNNEIKIISSYIKRDPRILEQVPDDTFKNKYGDTVEIYYVVNNSSKIEFYFISESYSHFYGHLKMSKKNYNKYYNEINDLLFNISDSEREIKKGYKKHVFGDEDIKLNMIYPEYWGDLAWIHERGATLEFDYSDENYMNGVHIYFDRDFNSYEYKSEEPLDTMKTNEGLDIYIYKDTRDKSSDNGFIMYIPDICLAIDIWMMDEIFQIHRGEIMEVVTSISRNIEDELIPISRDISEDTLIYSAEEENGVSFAYPYKYEDYIYYGSENTFDKVIIFHDFNEGENENIIEIGGFSRFERDPLDKSEIDEDETIKTDSGVNLYLIRDVYFEDRDRIIKNYNIGEMNYPHVYINMDREYYEEHFDEIMDFFKSISLN